MRTNLTPLKTKILVIRLIVVLLFILLFFYNVLPLSIYLLSVFFLNFLALYLSKVTKDLYSDFESQQNEVIKYQKYLELEKNRTLVKEKTINTLFDISNTVSKTQTDSKHYILKLVTNLIGAIPNSEEVIIRLKNGDLPDEFIYEGEIVALLAGSELYKAGKGYSGRSMETGKAILIQNTATNQLHQTLIQPFAEKEPVIYNAISKITSIVSAPIKANDEILGSIVIFSKSKPNCFGEDHLRMLQMICNEVGLFLINIRIYKELKDTYLGLIKLIGSAIDSKDGYTSDHSRHVAAFAIEIAKRLNFTELEREKLLISCLVHDIGILKIPEKILNKEGKLSEEEFILLRQHAILGEEILNGIPFFETIKKYVRSHHEQFDGRGYPDGLMAEEIPLCARIIAVADAFDAMTSERPYRKRLTFKEAVQELENNAGKQFDPQVVSVFLDFLKKRKT